MSELPFPSPGDCPDPEIEPASPALAGGFLTTKHHLESMRRPASDHILTTPLVVPYMINVSKFPVAKQQKPMLADLKDSAVKRKWRSSQNW